MLEQLLVELSYPFTANCAKCYNILFQIRVIDQFVRAKKQNSKQNKQQNIDAAKYYMLHSEILPSTLSIQKTSFLCQYKPFYMQFLGQVKCSECKDKIGIKMLTLSSDFHHPELLDRILIDASKVRIKTAKQDVTNQLLSRFSQQWDDNQTQIDQIDLSQNIMIKKQQKKPPQTNIPNKQAQTAGQKQHKKQQNSQQLKYLRKQMQQQNQQTKQIINQIVSSIDFFNQILISLQKRVSQTQNVCNLLKDRVEKIIPMLRKKNQQ